MSVSSVLRVLARLTNIELVGSLMYRVQFVVYMMSTFVGVVVGLFIWVRAGESGADLPVDQQYIVSYYLMLAVVRVLTTTWFSEWLAHIIRHGELNAWLVRPGSYLLNLLANNFAEKIVKIGIMLPLIGMTWFFYRDQFSLPTNPARWLGFVVALIGAATIEFALTTVIGSIGFWMDDNTGIARSRMMIQMVLSGEIVPLALYPAWSQGFLEWQPFRFMISFPLEVLLRDLSREQLTFGFAMQFFWGACAVVLARFVWQRGLHAYNAIGA